MNRILKGCLFHKRSENVSIYEQRIQFTGRYPYNQYVPNKPDPVEMKIFVLAATTELVLDFEIYQGLADFAAFTPTQVDLGLGDFIIARLSNSLSKIYCDHYFRGLKISNFILDKNIYSTGTGTKNQIAKAVKKLPYDKEMKKYERGASKSVVNREGNLYY